MTQLVTSQQFQTPSVLSSVQQGLVNRGEIQRQGILSREEANSQRLSELSQAQQSEQRGLLQTARGVAGVAPDEATQQQAIDLYYANDPKAGEDLFERLKIETTEQKEDLAAFSDSMLKSPDEATKQFLIDERVRKISARGGDPSETLILKDAGNPGKLTLEQRDAAMMAAKSAALTALQRETLDSGRERLAAEGKAPGQDPVQSSTILDDGTVQFVRKSGDVEVVPANEADKALIKEAKLFGAKLQGLRSGERKAGEAAIAQSVKAFEKLAPIKKNIKNLTEGIRLISEEGAESGVIAKHFPSMKTASINLDNLQARLGLDIIADVTFGALSESELAFAKDTALPIGLEGPALVDWLTRKRDAQKILAQHLTDAALFLGDPGNSIPDYIRMKRAQQDQPTAPQAQPAAAQPPGQGDLTPGEQAELAELKRRLGR